MGASASALRNPLPKVEGTPPSPINSTSGRSFLALDTRLGWDFATSTFVPIVKGVAGLYVDRQKSLSISVWYQATLSQAAASQIYEYGVGMGLAYFFDW